MACFWLFWRFGGGGFFRLGVAGLGLYGCRKEKKH